MRETKIKKLSQLYEGFVAEPVYLADHGEYTKRYIYNDVSPLRSELSNRWDRASDFAIVATSLPKALGLTLPRWMVHCAGFANGIPRASWVGPSGEIYIKSLFSSDYASKHPRGARVALPGILGDLGAISTTLIDTGARYYVRIKGGGVPKGKIYTIRVEHGTAILTPTRFNVINTNTADFRWDSSSFYEDGQEAPTEHHYDLEEAKAIYTAKAEEHHAKQKAFLTSEA